jgi:protein tyrosine phosphatase
MYKTSERGYIEQVIINSSNFREINMGKIPPKTLYRSNHPICNAMQVEDIILAANYANINTIINLSDNARSLKSKIISCPWYKKYYESNTVIALNINMDFDIADSVFKKKIKSGILFMIEHVPPYLIHCEAGIDRTGFLSMLLESFMETEIKDIARDYMLSFVDKTEYSLNDYKNGSLFIRNLFSKIKGEPIGLNEDLQSLAAQYLVESIGLNNNEINLLSNRLAN